MLRRSAAPGTDEQYLTWCKQSSIQPVTETLKDGTNAYWVGSRGAEYVWIYFHGQPTPYSYSILH